MTALVCFLCLSAPDTDRLVAEYFGADAPRRAEILRALAPVDALDADGVAKWRKKLRALAAKAGPKLRRSGTNYFYDKKTKRGKYMVGGSSGRGGLVIALHGGGEGAGDAGGAHGTFSPIAARHRCICIAPEVLEKTERGWTTSGTEEFLLELIDAAKRTWKKIPHDRVYMVGHSMGGYGSWTVGAHHADLFAGLGPYAGAPTPITEDGQPYGKVVGLVEGVIPNLRNVALHVYQSLDDKQVPPEPNVFANRTVLEWRELYGGYDRYRYVEVDGHGHDAPPGGHKKGFSWLYGFEREARPKRILWQPVLSYKRMFYWLWWDRPVPNALVEARVAAPNEIHVDLQGHDRTGFRLLLDKELVDFGKEIVVREGGEEVVRARVGFTLSTMLMTAAERYDPESIYPAHIDLEGGRGK